MTNTAFFGYSNAVDLTGTAITCSSQLSNLPATNLIDPDLQRVWVTADASDAWVAAVFPSAQSVRAFGVGGWLATSTAKVRHRLYSDAGMTTTVYDSGLIDANVVPNYWTAAMVRDAAVTAVRAYRVDISDPDRSTAAVNGQSAGDHIIGRLWASNGVQPLYNMSYPVNWKWCSLTEKQRGRRSGAVSVDPGPKYRECSFGFEALTENEAMVTFDDFLATVSLERQILFVQEPGGTYQQRQAVFCKRSEASPMTRATLPTWSHAMTLEEDPALGA